MIVPLLQPHPDFHVLKPTIILPFGDLPCSKLNFATTYLLERYATYEVYIGEAEDVRARLIRHRSQVKKTGHIHSNSRFSSPLKPTDLITKVWNIQLSDFRYRKLHEFLLCFFFEKRNVGKAGSGRSELYGHIFILPCGKEIHTFDITLFDEMYSIPKTKRKTNLKLRGIKQQLACREDVFEAYPSVFN